MPAKILVLAGSVRNGSLNVELARTLTAALVAKGADVVHVSLSDYELPIFNADIAVPDNAVALGELFSTSDGMVMVSPEYNASLSPLLKNALDWVSVTKKPDDSMYGPYRDKICYLASCSPGAIGGLRGLYHLRAVLMNVGAEIITSQLAVGNGGKAFDGNGGFSEERLTSLMDKGLNELLFSVERVKAVPRS